MSTSATTFVAVNFGTRAAERSVNENSPRERKAVRIARAKNIYAQGGVKYLGIIPEAGRKALAAEQTIKTPDGKELSIKQPAAAACVLCSGVHDLSDPNLSRKITFWLDKDGKSVFALSDTCRLEYVDGYSAKLTNPATYLADFPKPEKR